MVRYNISEYGVANEEIYVLCERINVDGHVCIRVYMGSANDRLSSSRENKKKTSGLIKSTNTIGYTIIINNDDTVGKKPNFERYYTLS